MNLFLRFLTGLSLLIPAPAVQANIAINQVDYYIASEDLRIRLLPNEAEGQARCVIRKIGDKKPLGVPIGEIKFPLFFPIPGRGTPASEALWAALGPNPYGRWHLTSKAWTSNGQNLPKATLERALSCTAEFDGRIRSALSMAFNKPGAVEYVHLLPSPLPAEVAVVWFAFDPRRSEFEFPATITFRQPYYRVGNKLRFYYAPVFSNHDKAGVRTDSPTFAATLTWQNGLKPRIIRSSPVIERGENFVRIGLANRVPILVEIAQHQTE